MPFLVSDLIQASLEELGVYAPGETIATADQTRAFNALNQFMDVCANHSQLSYAITEQSGPLVIGQSAYTIGSGGNFNMLRPLRIITGPGAAYVQDANSNNYDVDVVERDRWNMIGDRTTTSQIPTTIFYDPQYPLGIINVFPVPLAAYTLFWDSYLQIGQFAAVGTTIALPPGYIDMLQHNLAVRLGPFFKNQPVSQDIKDLARETLAAVKRTNTREVIATFDSEIVARATPTYNIYRDRQGS